MAPPVAEDALTQRLLLRLRALGSPARLQILRALVVPARPADIRVHAAGERAGLGASRFLGRTTVIEHLDVLEEAGLARRIGDAYALDQQGMVALVQEIGELARLRAIVEVDVDTTRVAAPPAHAPLPLLPRLLVANGPLAGRAYALAASGPWRIGRGAECEVSLAHDPHVSRVQATLSHKDGAFVLEVAAGAKNPVHVDFSAVEPGARAPVRPGSLLSVGATVLALQV